jgi:hypothetical protein
VLHISFARLLCITTGFEAWTAGDVGDVECGIISRRSRSRKIAAMITVPRPIC